MFNFIEKAKAKHGSFYDYSKTNYINQRTKVVIICPKHGFFEQNPNNHIRGKGCKHCASEKSSIRQKITTEQFILKAVKIHGDKYDYSRVEYFNAHSNITIICKLHGCFIQEPTNHLSGRGCNNCGNISMAQLQSSTKKEFIKKANIIHNDKYDYSLVEYINARKKVKIYCPKHKNYFEQTPDNHLRGNGCVLCSHNCSNIETLWLNHIGVKNDKEHRQVRLVIDDRIIKADGYDPATNTIYEFYGDFWHGNPKIYNSTDINNMTKTTFGSLYDKTMEKEKFIKEKGFNLITIWQNDFIKSTDYSLQCFRKT